jgi:hypothetical protein
MAYKIQIRRDTAANWTASNAVLADGEQGWEKDTNKMKVGDGVTVWGELGYFGGDGGAGNALQLKPPTITTWNAGNFKDGQIKTTVAAYYQDASKSLEQRFDWSEDLTVKRIEIKDSLSGTWVQRNYTWANDLPSVEEVVITAWTIN